MNVTIASTNAYHIVLLGFGGVILSGLYCIICFLSIFFMVYLLLAEDLNQKISWEDRYLRSSVTGGDLGEFSKIKSNKNFDIFDWGDFEENLERISANEKTGVSVYKSHFGEDECIIKLFPFQFEKDIYIPEFDDENILKCLGITLGTESTLGLILEYCNKYDLEKYIVSTMRKKKKILYEVKLRIMYQVAKAMKLMHSRGYVHKLLVPKNIFVSEINDNVNVKVSVFAMPKLFKTKITGLHKAPEILMHNKSIDEKIDVYSFAFVMYSVWTGNFRPWKDFEKKNLKLRISADESMRPFLSRNDFDEEKLWLYELIVKCWSQKKINRPSFVEIEKVLEKEYMLSEETSSYSENSIRMSVMEEDLKINVQKEIDEMKRDKVEKKKDVEKEEENNDDDEEGKDDSNVY